MQREVAILENRADPHGEGLAAGVALPQAWAAALASQAADPLVIAIAAMGANRAFRPQMGLDVGKSCFLIVKMRGGQNWIGHGNLPMASILYLVFGVVKCNFAKRGGYNLDKAEPNIVKEQQADAAPCSGDIERFHDFTDTGGISAQHGNHWFVAQIAGRFIERYFAGEYAYCLSSPYASSPSASWRWG